MTSRRRTGALLSVIGTLVASLLVASPAAAEPPSCDVVVPLGGDVIELREGKGWDVRLVCDGQADSLKVTAAQSPGHGTVGAISWDAEYDEWLVPYTPTDGYTGPDSFTLSAAATGAEPAEVVVDLLMEPNRAPSCNQRDAVYDHVRVDERWTMTLTCDDLDLQDYGDLEPVVDVGPAHGTLDLAVEDGQYGLDELTLTYSPDPGFTGSDHFVAGATDGDLVDVDEFFLHVADGPWCTEDADPLEVIAGRTGTVYPNCSDPDLTWPPHMEVVTQPSHGSIVVRGPVLDYTADPDASGPDSFSYRMTSDLGVSNVVTQTVDITPNAAPVCALVTTSTPRDTPVEVSLSCSDADGDELEVAVTGVPAHGTLTPLVDGTVTYSPEVGYDGTDTFTFEAADFARSSGPTTVKVAVTENDAPVITVSVEDQSPARAARRGLLAGMYASEPVTADVVVRVPARVARRLDLGTRVIGTLTDDAKDLTRLTVPLTRRAERAVRDVRRLPLRVTVTATDEWGNATTKGRRAVLR
jgi:hypothetical protein